MGMEYSPKAKRKARAKRHAFGQMPKASPCTVRRADGSVTVVPALDGHVDQVKKR